MFCTNCGKELPEGVNFCPFCGVRVAAPAGRTAPVPPQDDLFQTGAEAAEPVQPVEEESLASEPLACEPLEADLPVSDHMTSDSPASEPLESEPLACEPQESEPQPYEAPAAEAPADAAFTAPEEPQNETSAPASPVPGVENQPAPDGYSFGQASQQGQPAPGGYSFGQAGQQGQQAPGGYSFGQAGQQGQPAPGGYSFGQASQQSQPAPGGYSFGQAGQQGQPAPGGQPDYQYDPNSQTGQNYSAPNGSAPNYGGQTFGNYAGDAGWNTAQDRPSVGLNILGFLFPVIGLILFLVMRKSSPVRARSIGKWTIIGFVIGLVLLIILANIGGSSPSGYIHS